MKLNDVLAALLVVIIWGGNFVVIRLGLNNLPPILFTALRFLFAAFPLVFFIKRPAIPFRLLAGYGLFQFALQFTFLFSGIHLGFPPGLASLVIQLQAFFTIGLAVLLLDERPRRSQLLGGLIALSGMAVVAAHLEARPTVIGFAMVIAGGICWSVGNILTKKMGRTNALGVVVWGSLIATPPLLVTSFVIEGVSAWQLAAHGATWVSVAAVLFQSYPNTILGYGIWSRLMQKYPTAAIAPFPLLVPVTGMLASAIVLGEALQSWKIGAGVLVLSGLAMNQFGGRWFAAWQKRKEPNAERVNQ